MTKNKEQNSAKTYQCEKCGFWYKDEEIKEKCQKWCKEHKSCNLEIIKHSIKNMTNNNSQPIRQVRQARGGEFIKPQARGEKGFAMPVVIAIVVLVVVVGGIGYFATRTNLSPTVTTQTPADEKTLPDSTVVKTEGTTAAKYTGTVLAGKSAPLLDYNKADYDAAIAGDKLVVLYFYANWCPICKEELADSIYPTFNELITDKVVGIRINYKDSDTDKDEENLARQYGISYQHTKVFVKNGKQILKAPDGWDKLRYITEINKALVQ